MKNQKITINFHPLTDGDWNSSTDFEPETLAIVAINVLQVSWKKLNQTLNDAAIAAGYVSYGQAPPDWVLSQTVNDIVKEEGVVSEG